MLCTCVPMFFLIQIWILICLAGCCYSGGEDGRCIGEDQHRQRSTSNWALDFFNFLSNRSHVK
uniref:Uncharacterized protein n=1 Tax=Arundo donax TaxID=35708 RepID=A0A0A9S1W1_ARUDO